MNEAIIGMLILLIGYYVIIQHAIFEWMNSREKIQTEVGEFRDNMRKLGESEAADEILMQFKNYWELMDVNKRLKKCIK